MTASRRRFLRLASVAFAAPTVSRRAFAAEWPKDKIIRKEIGDNRRIAQQAGIEPR